MSIPRPKPEDLKYNASLYIDSGILTKEANQNYRRKNESLIKCIGERTCANCNNTIHNTEYMLRITLLFRGQGYKRRYICTSCVEKWLEDSGQVSKKGSN